MHRLKKIVKDEVKCLRSITLYASSDVNPNKEIDDTHKARRVIVAMRLGVAKGWNQNSC